MKQVFLSLEYDGEDEEDKPTYKLAILEVSGEGRITPKTSVRKMLSDGTYAKEKALEVLMLQARRSFFDE